MKRQEAKKLIGQVVNWPNMDARIDSIKTILERVGAHGIATVSYSVTSNWGTVTTERFVTYKHVTELFNPFE